MQERDSGTRRFILANIAIIIRRRIFHINLNEERLLKLVLKNDSLLNKIGFSQTSLFMY